MGAYSLNYLQNYRMQKLSMFINLLSICILAKKQQQHLSMENRPLVAWNLNIDIRTPLRRSHKSKLCFHS